MFDAFILISLVALFVAWVRTAARLRVLEKWVAELSEARPAMPTFEPVMERVEPPGRLVDRVAPVTQVRPDLTPEPAIEPEPVIEDFAAPAPRETVAGLFERFVGGRLLVWTGGIAMALAGLFLVRYSIELGLIGPRVRMIAAAVFGVALVAGGEVARRRYPDDPRIGQALVGAGVLILYAAAYGSHILYGLITLTTAFVLMAAIATAALGLSLRHGTPTAALGLVGGFVTPLLVGRSTGEAEPLLLYLTLLNLAVFAVAVRSSRPWLGWAAKLMTLFWTGFLLNAAPDDALLTGAFLLVHTIVTGLAWRDEPVPSLGPTIALAQMGAVVPLGGFAPEAWLLLLGFGIAGYALAQRSRVLAAVPPRTLLAALLLMAGHLVFAPTEALAPWAVATTSLFAGGSWWRLDRTSRLWSTLTFCAGVAGPALLMRAGRPELLPDAGWGVLVAALAMAPAALAWRMRDAARPDAPFDGALLLAVTTATGLLAVAVHVLLPRIWWPAGWMLVALAVAVASRRLGDGGVSRLALVALGGAVLAAASQAQPLWTMLAGAAFGAPALAGALPPIAGTTPVGAALALFALPGAIAFAIARFMSEPALRKAAVVAAGTLAGVAAYMLFKQIFGLRDAADFVARGFAERTLLTQGLFFAGWLLLKRPRLSWLIVPATVLTTLAAARFAWFDLFVYNPAARAQDVGALPGFNLILLAYLGTAFWLFEARRRAMMMHKSAPITMSWLALFLAALVTGVGLLVRQAFQGAILTGAAMPRAEFYGYSLGGLLLSVALLMFGTRRGDTPLRVAGLALLTATVVKVFVFDAAALEGLLRIASFAGLGAALMGMGKLYGTVLGPRGGSALPAASRHIA